MGSNNAEISPHRTVSHTVNENPNTQAITMPSPGDLELSMLDEQSMEMENVQGRSRIKLVLLMSALYLTMFMVALDYTIMATAIPTISSELHSASGYAWIGGANLLASAAAGPIWTKLSDIFGRKSIMLYCNAIFIAASLICAKASSMEMLIAGRALQGVGGGGLNPLIMAVISDLFSVRARSIYIALLEGCWMLAAGVGPVLSGVFTQELSWRWAFWINLPVAGVTFLIMMAFLDVHNPRTRLADGIKAIDWFGSISITAVVVMVLLGLEFGGVTFAWNSPQVICLIVFGSLMSLFFVFSEKRLAEYPLMPMRLFNNRSSVACYFLAFFHGLVYIGPEYFLPLYFQSAKGFSPLFSGILTIPITAGAAIAGIFTGIVIARTGRYLELIWGGVVIMALGNGLFILLGTQTSLAVIVIIQIVAGMGAAPHFQAPLVAIQAIVSQEDTATAIATFNFVRNIGTALSVLIGGVLFQNSMDIRVKTLTGPPIDLPANITHALTGGNAAANVFLVDDVQDQLQKMAIREAYAWSMRNLFILFAGFSALALIASIFIKRHYLRTDHVENKTGLKAGEPIAPN